ncbi:amino acid--tRNA ligase-related protein [Candidatus Vidania fulgoroideorum]
MKIKDIKKISNIIKMSETKKINIAGRVVRKNNFGGIVFLKILDFSGNIQAIMKKKNTVNFKFFSININLGDLIYIKGKTFLNKRNQKCLVAIRIKIIAKNFIPFPDKYHKIVDEETKYNKRHLEFNTNENSFKKILLRSEFIQKIRIYMYKKKFIEIETPILNKITGGADAKEFKTYCNYFNKNMFLRISPEIYLKKSIICGFNKIFEIGKNFRNEGISKNHYPEFTFIEFYSIYTDYKWSMAFVEKMLKNVIYSVFKKSFFNYNNEKIFYLNDFEIISIKKSILKYQPHIYEKINDINFFKNEIKKIYSFKKYNEIKELSDINIFHYYYFEKKIIKYLIQPTFITHFPISVSPLAEKYKNKNLSKRYELYICKKEIANGYTEINDYKEQKKRFTEQKKRNKKEIDNNYIDYMKFGMPPTSGCGIGLDRILMLITDSKNIKDVIIFTH